MDPCIQSLIDNVKVKRSVPMVVVNSSTLQVRTIQYSKRACWETYQTLCGEKARQAFMMIEDEIIKF